MTKQQGKSLSGPEAAKGSRGKKILYSIIMIVFMIVVIEAGLHILYAVMNRQFLPIRSIDETMHRLASQGESPGVGGQMAAGEADWGGGYFEAIHPYLGFVADPKKTQYISDFGFPENDSDPLPDKPGNSVVIALFGGSFAHGESVHGGAVMKAVLRGRGINSRIVNVAIGGYKQPQQLLSLAYLLSHGAPIDVVVNIDGFNEVALPQAENIPKGVNPFYPRSWYGRTVGIHDRTTLRLTGRGSALREDRRQWAALFSGLAANERLKQIQIANKASETTLISL